MEELIGDRHCHQAHGLFGTRSLKQVQAEDSFKKSRSGMKTRQSGSQTRLEKITQILKNIVNKFKT